MLIFSQRIVNGRLKFFTKCKLHAVASRVRRFRRILKNEIPEILVNSSIFLIYHFKIDFVFSRAYI
jgi:hypothetical protein